MFNKEVEHLKLFIMKTTTVQINFTVTRSNHKGLVEWLTEKGWRSENAISENQLEKLYFNNEDGSKKVKELKADCRIPAMKKSIILNYS